MNFRLTKNARIRTVVGFLSITLGLMEILNPGPSRRWQWLRDWVAYFAGDYGYAGLLICIGIFFVSWAVLESLNARGDGK